MNHAGIRAGECCAGNTSVYHLRFVNEDEASRSQL